MHNYKCNGRSFLLKKNVSTYFLTREFCQKRAAGLGYWLGTHRILRICKSCRKLIYSSKRLGWTDSTHVDIQVIKRHASYAIHIYHAVCKGYAGQTNHALMQILPVNKIFN